MKQECLRNTRLKKYDIKYFAWLDKNCLQDAVIMTVHFL